MILSDRISVILIETHTPGNIGSTARAMHNMGLRRLKLVNPTGRLSTESQKMAGKSYDLVMGASIYDDFDSAVADENLLVGTTSSRDRKSRQRLYTPREIAPLVLEHSQTQNVALVFGPERRGLSEEQLTRCQYHVTIPSDPDQPVLNLAQAVLILAYEIYSLQAPELNPSPELASHKEREQMFLQMEEVLIEIGFLSSGNPDHIMRSIRRFLSKSDLTPRDVQILRGIMSQMKWYVEEGRHLPPESIRKP